MARPPDVMVRVIMMVDRDRAVRWLRVLDVWSHAGAVALVSLHRYR